MYKKIILGILISGLFIYLSVRGINLSDVLQTLKEIRPDYIAIFILLLVLMQYLRSYRWGVILEPLEKVNQFSLFSVSSVGFLAIAAVPARIGELARPYLLAQKSSIKMSSALGTVVIERVLDFVSILVIVASVFLFYDLPSWLVKSGLVFCFLTLFLCCIVFLLIMRRDVGLQLINKFLSKLPGDFAYKIDALIHRFIDGFQIVTNIRRLFYLLFLSFSVWLLDVLTIYILLKAFGFQLPVIASFMVMIILIIGIAIPTAPGYIGSWHYSCILALSLFDVTKPAALSFAVVYHFLSIAIIIFFGVLFLPFNRFYISDLKSLLNSTTIKEGKDRKINF
jgi:uncharacterized protein (TIRG00374 family)